MKPRPYQVQSMELIRNEFIRGNKKVLLWLATGAGKTFVFCRMVTESVARGRKCIIIVRGRKLVDQASQRLFREHVSHGVLMAGHWNYRPSAPVQVCSIDTLKSRKIYPEADLVIIDEAHLFTSDADKEYLKNYQAYMVAVTATPWVPKGLRHLANTIVHPVTMNDLVADGHLVSFRYFAPSTPDLSDVKVSSQTKDYVNAELETAMSTNVLTGKIIDHWIKIAEEKPTICFCVNIHHSKMLVDKFKAAGIKAEHCDADSSDAERDEVVKRLENGETKVVCNVGIFCTGVDIPNLGAIIMARPTKSLNLYIQQAGRGTRNSPGKTNCILLDHAGNLARHGFPTEEPDVDLDGREKRVVIRESKTCKNCFAVFVGSVCPECAYVPPARDAFTPPEETSEELKEILDVDPISYALKVLARDAKKAGKKPASAFYKLIDKFGFEKAEKYLPRYFVDYYISQQKNLFSGSPFKGTAKPPTLKR